MAEPLADSALSSFLAELNAQPAVSADEVGPRTLRARAEERADPRVSPLYTPDLTGLPAAIVITCEHDPLRDQGEAYASRLRDAGVLLTGRREQGMVHNFMYWDLVSPACAAAADRVAADLRSALATASGQS